jgi:hypothetical protein
MSRKALVLVYSAATGAESYCDDPEVVTEWSAVADKYARSNDWQGLYALWLALC